VINQPAADRPESLRLIIAYVTVNRSVQLGRIIKLNLDTANQEREKEREISVSRTDLVRAAVCPSPLSLPPSSSFLFRILPWPKDQVTRYSDGGTPLVPKRDPRGADNAVGPHTAYRCPKRAPRRARSLVRRHRIARCPRRRHRLSQLVERSIDVPPEEGPAPLRTKRGRLAIDRTLPRACSPELQLGSSTSCQVSQSSLDPPLLNPRRRAKRRESRKVWQKNGR